MSDEPDRQDLEDRVEQLEATIAKMLPSRRDALKLGGAALVGGAAMSGSASAGTEQAGTIGTANDPVDVESEDINNADTVTTDKVDTRIVELGSTSQSNGGRMLIMSRFSGSNPNIRFDNCLANAENGDLVILEDGVSQDKTLTTKVILTGTGAQTFFNANLTIDTSRVILKNFRLNRFTGNQIVVNNQECLLTGIYFPEIILNDNQIVVVGNVNISVIDNGGANAVVGNS